MSILSKIGTAAKDGYAKMGEVVHDMAEKTEIDDKAKAAWQDAKSSEFAQRVKSGASAITDKLSDAFHSVTSRIDMTDFKEKCRAVFSKVTPRTGLDIGEEKGDETSLEMG